MALRISLQGLIGAALFRCTGPYFTSPFLWFLPGFDSIKSQKSIGQRKIIITSARIGKIEYERQSVYYLSGFNRSATPSHLFLKTIIPTFCTPIFLYFLFVAECEPCNIDFRDRHGHDINHSPLFRVSGTHGSSYLLNRSRVTPAGCMIGGWAETKGSPKYRFISDRLALFLLFK